jgi:peptidoglycan/xylan/chitin deacetylase (PgdA/CDA1 family)
MYKTFKISKLAYVIVIVFGVYVSGTILDKLNAENDDSVFLPVIMYHSIYKDTSLSKDYIITPETLADDLGWLYNNGYHTVLPEDLVSYIDNGTPLPEKPVMLTFDDGNYNNMVYLMPLLEKYDMRAVISVVGEFTEFFSTNGDEHKERYSYLTWDDIKALADSRRIEIGNHTYNLHYNNQGRKGAKMLAGEDVGEYSEMLWSDVGLLQSELHNKSEVMPITFTYPFGHISKESEPVLKEMGFRVFLTCYEKPNYISRGNPNCLYSINRYNRPSGISTEEFMQKITR